MEQNKLAFQYFTLRQSILEMHFSRMNQRQLEAVLSTEGPLLILAGAGSGKTTVLIEKIVHLLKFGTQRTDTPPAALRESWLKTMADYLVDPTPEKCQMAEALCANDTVRPWEIIAITFTNKAANELKERLEQAIGPDGKDIWAQTFHSACVRILRRYGEELGYPRDFAIYDEDDKKRMITAILRRFDLDEKMYEPKAIAGEISRAKDRLQSVQQYENENRGDRYHSHIADVFREYEKRMKAAGAMDFDDLIVKTVSLLQNNEEARTYYQRKFKYVLVDEYQDTNYAQYALTQLLAGGYGNICVVGDDDQSIYKFRGATISNILEFEQHYPNAKVIRLEQNYRSTGRILNAANGVIANTAARKGKTLWTENGEGAKIHLFRGDNQETEAEYIARVIVEDYAKGKSWGSHAILYRNHVLSNALENAFRRNSIPYRIHSGLRFFDRQEVKDMLAYLWLINNTSDDLRLKRIINVPARKIGARTVEIMEELAARENTSLFQIAAHAADYPELSRAGAALADFARLILDLKEMLGYLSLDEFYNQLLEHTGYQMMLEAKDDEEHRGKLENVLELKSNIAEYQGRAEEATLSGFLEEVSLLTDLDNRDTEANAVVLMTMHGAKGLEFPTVFLCGLEEGLFPSFRSLERQEDLEEERRICYVAMTRAKRELYLTYTQRRMMYGQTRHNAPSRFLEEIPQELLESNISRREQQREAAKSAATAVRQQGSKHAYQSSFQSQSAGTASAKAAAPAVEYTVGQRVKHKAFGQGVITAAQKVGGDTLLTIDFEGAGVKRLMGKSAQQFMVTL